MLRTDRLNTDDWLPVYLGIDGGGSKTAACVVDNTGNELGRGLSGPCNVATCSPEVLRASIGEAAHMALRTAGAAAGGRIAGVCAGVAGYASHPAREAFEGLLREIVPAYRYRIEPDFVIAHWGASLGAESVLVSAGTGSVVYGRTSDGRSARADGRGFLLGDDGSAFALGRAVLSELVWSLDAGHPPLPVGLRVAEHIGASDPDAVIDWVHRDFAPARIATLGATIAEWAREGDKDALRALAPAAYALASSVEAVMRRLALPVEGTPLYLVGGLWDAGGPVMRKRFARTLSACAKGRAGVRGRRSVRLDLLEPLRDPAAGAALLAMASPETA